MEKRRWRKTHIEMVSKGGNRLAMVSRVKAGWHCEAPCYEVLTAERDTGEWGTMARFIRANPGFVVVGVMVDKDGEPDEIYPDGDVIEWEEINDARYPVTIQGARSHVYVRQPCGVYTYIVRPDLYTNGSLEDFETEEEVFDHERSLKRKKHKEMLDLEKASEVIGDGEDVMDRKSAIRKPVTVTMVFPWDKALEINRAAEMRGLTAKEFMLDAIYDRANRGS